MSSDNIKGLVLALSSSFFIGASFIVKKKGLKKAGASGLCFAPAILVTPLGALSIIISAALARIILRERLHIFGILGCVLCVVGSTTIVLHAPQEREIESVAEVSIGHECESSWNSFEVDIFRDESANISANMGFHYSRFCLCDYPNELFEQGS
uniref:Probable magnesium transporter n=1 Tax=Ananas comosus var. bracteatus TaxID=296719 RepID=A0A6V7Q6G4_ANACO|nr:unnamed protein product [Ananas comosus var. bracteatus]